MLEAFKHSCLNNTVKSGMVMLQHLSEGMDPKAVFDYKLGSRNWGTGKLHGIVSIARTSM